MKNRGAEIEPQDISDEQKREAKTFERTGCLRRFDQTGRAEAEDEAETGHGKIKMPGGMFEGSGMKKIGQDRDGGPAEAREKKRKGDPFPKL